MTVQHKNYRDNDVNGVVGSESTMSRSAVDPAGCPRSSSSETPAYKPSNKKYIKK